MNTQPSVDELAELQQKRINCPIPWCVGRALDHGADGAGPESWLHESVDESLEDVLTLSRIREGSGPDRFSVVVDLPAARDYDAAGMRDLAARLRRAATALEWKAR